MQEYDNDLDIIDGFEEDADDDEELEDDLELAVVPAGAQLTGDRVEDARRTHHNRLEKRRRQSLRASYQRLLHALPASPSGLGNGGGASNGSVGVGNGGSAGSGGSGSNGGCVGVQTTPGPSRDKTSRAQILQRAVDYIKELQNITRSQSEDLARIDRENEALTNELDDLEQAVASANQMVNQDDLPPSPPTSPETDQDADGSGEFPGRQQLQHPVPIKRMKYSG